MMGGLRVIQLAWFLSNCEANINAQMHNLVSANVEDG